MHICHHLGADVSDFVGTLLHIYTWGMRCNLHKSLYLGCIDPIMALDEVSRI